MRTRNKVAYAVELSIAVEPKSYIVQKQHFATERYTAAALYWESKIVFDMKPLYSFVSKVFLHSFPQKYFYIFTICQWRSQNVEKDKPKGDNCLFDLILYVPSTIYQLNRDGSSWVKPDKCVLLKDHNAVTPVRLEPAAPRSRVKHSATWPLHSLQLRVKSFFAFFFSNVFLHFYNLAMA